MARNGRAGLNVAHLDCLEDLYQRCIDSIRERLMHVQGENQYPHYATSISSGMISGTVCDGDTDCSDATGADSAPAAAADDDDGGDPDPEPERRRQHPPHPQAVAPTPARAPERGTATATAGEPSPRIDPASELWRLPAVLAHVPISRSSWFAGVKAGRYPKPVRLSERRVAWRASDIRSFVAAL